MIYSTVHVQVDVLTGEMNIESCNLIEDTGNLIEGTGNLIEDTGNLIEGTGNLIEVIT